jgi:Short-chain alcohol dehydrogenase of unknown specificity
MPSVLVTGAGRGIGLAITERMSRRGWNVYATARSDAALHSLDRLPNVHAIALDITDRSAIAALPDQLPAELNGVVNNAGIIVNGPVEGLSLDDLTQQLDINVISQIAVTQAVLPKSVTPGGGWYSCRRSVDCSPHRAPAPTTHRSTRSSPWPMHSVWSCVRGAFPCHSSSQGRSVPICGLTRSTTTTI